MKKVIFAVVVMSLVSCGGRTRSGAICNDGSRSYATGSGACSHHGGVDHWVYK
jgi:hypothetical protein